MENIKADLGIKMIKHPNKKVYYSFEQNKEITLKSYKRIIN